MKAGMQDLTEVRRLSEPLDLQPCGLSVTQCGFPFLSDPEHGGGFLAASCYLPSVCAAVITDLEGSKSISK